jgi:hypothetical protein
MLLYRAALAPYHFWGHGFAACLFGPDCNAIDGRSAGDSRPDNKQVAGEANAPGKKNQEGRN